MLLHGTDMDKHTNPFEAGLDRFVHMDKESVYSWPLRRIIQQGVPRKLTGLEMVERGVPRHGFHILRDGATVGQVTSGGYSPTLDRNIGLGYVPTGHSTSGSRFQIDVRGRSVEAEAAALPFYSRKRV